MVAKRRIVGVAAGCAVTVATLLGSPSASAEETSESPVAEPPGYARRAEATANALAKLESLDNPGAGKYIDKFPTVD